MKRYLRVRSRHPSHNILRSPKNRVPGDGILCDHLALIRLGSVTESNIPIQINSIEGVKNSKDKLLMKRCFDREGVKTAKWDVFDNFETISEKGITFKDNQLNFPVVIKHRRGSRNRGNTLISNLKEFKEWFNRKDYNNYIVEQYCKHSREYRLHVTEDGCFYTNRKLLKSDAKERWYRNDSNCVWILETNEGFNKPDSWDLIVADCVKALNAVGLDVGACDVKVDTKGNFVVIEINSAPSFGQITAEKYKEIIPILVNKKANK